MSSVDIIIIIWVVAVAATISEILLSAAANIDTFITSPRNLYAATKLNIVTCWTLFILLRIVSPIVTLVLFSHWVTHVGRKD